MKIGVISVQWALASALSLGVSSLHSQEFSRLPDKVVTANRSEQLLVQALPHTTVIGRDVIERSQAVDLPGLLASEAGFQFTQSGGRGTSATLFLRGSASLQVLVLIDGIPLTKQDSTGSVSLEHIMLDQVERVEVVRGNVSAIYGSGAVGGVIQIFMRKASAQPTAFARMEVGSYGSSRFAAGAAGRLGSTQFFVGVGREKTDGFSAMNGAQFPLENPDADGYRNSHFNLGFSSEILSGHTWGFRSQGSDGQFDTDGGGFGSATDIHRGSSHLTTWQIYSHNQILDGWRSKLSYGQGRERSVYDARLTAFPYDSEATTRTQTLNWTHEVDLTGWLLAMGIESQRQRIDATDSYATDLNRQRNVMAWFAGLSGSQGAHSVQLNLRRDDAEGLAAQDTAYVGYGYQFTPQWKWIASTSSAFNLPPLGYLYDPFSGNPNLRAETARSNEWGAQWADGQQVVRATLFSTRTSNLMQYDFSTYSFSNVADATNQGLEVSYTGKVEYADMRSSLTLQDPRDESNGSRLIRRARTMASLAASVPWGAWTVGGEIRYTGERPDIVTAPSLPAFVLVNLTLRHALTPSVALTARVENLTDQAYQSAYGYNQSGRALYAGVVWNPK